MTHKRLPVGLEPLGDIPQISTSSTNHCCRKLAKKYLQTKLKKKLTGLYYEYMRMYIHRNLSINLPAHKVANATLIENTRIFPTLSLQ